MVDSYYYIKTAGKIFGILMLLLLIPVMVFEGIILNGIVDYSFPGVISGSLVNIGEKQLLNSGFTPVPGTQRHGQLEKKDTLLVGDVHIPVKILIRFDQPLDNMEFFLATGQYQLALSNPLGFGYICCLKPCRGPGSTRSQRFYNGS